jgi:hypothetical protein
LNFHCYDLHLYLGKKPNFPCRDTLAIPPSYGSDLSRGHRQVCGFGRSAWRRAGEHVVPLFAFPPAITRAMRRERLNRSLRWIIKPAAAFPNDEAALKILFLAIRNGGLRWRRRIEWRAAIGQLRSCSATVF